jgi:hypothetical protein
VNEAGLQNPVLTNRNGRARPGDEDEQAHPCDVRTLKSPHGRCSRPWRKEKALTGGGLGLSGKALPHGAEARFRGLGGTDLEKTARSICREGGARSSRQDDRKSEDSKQSEEDSD